MGVASLAYFTTYLTTISNSVTTFGISFLVGMGGAGVYLTLLLMTEKNLTVLDNSLVKDLNLMTVLFVISGGFVAAITQTTAGAFSQANLQSVFMIGFGWQGALTGVAGSSTRAKLTDEIDEVKKIASEGLTIALQAKDFKIQQLTEALKEVSTK